MAEILGAATSATKFFLEVNKISIDNGTFKLFYKATTSILLACSAIAGSKQFFGDPINCEVNHGGVNEGTLHAYCWMYSTFNLPLDFKGACTKREHDGTSLYNSYYQWVSLFLMLSALMFYVPRLLWLMMEGGLMGFLSKGTTGKIVEDADEKRTALIRTFNEHLNNKYNLYASWFFFLEQMNFVVVLSQWFLTNRFLRYHFLRYGPATLYYYSRPVEEVELWLTNPMCEAFPRIASCNYIRYGGGGMQESRNAICILGLNMINDKIFLVLWFWYLFLTLFGISRLFYRVLQIASPRFRGHILRLRIRRYFKASTSTARVDKYIRKCSIGNWFVLYQMSRNMNRRFFVEFLTLLSVQDEEDLDDLPADQWHLMNKDARLLINSLDHRLGSIGGDTCPDERVAGVPALASRRASRISRVPSCVSLHSQTYDLTFDSGSPDKDEEEAKSEGKDNKSSGKTTIEVKAADLKPTCPESDSKKPTTEGKKDLPLREGCLNRGSIVSIEDDIEEYCQSKALRPQRNSQVHSKYPKK